MLNKLMVAERDEARTAHDAFNRSSMCVCSCKPQQQSQPGSSNSRGRTTFSSILFVIFVPRVVKHNVLFFFDKRFTVKTVKRLSNEHGRLKAKAQLIFRLYLVPRCFQSPSR